MKDLIKVTTNDKGEQLVSGRDLHEKLQIKTPYTQWMDRMLEYGFVENVDFSVFHKNVKDDTAFGGERKITDHVLTLDTAKHIAMIQRTDIGMKIRAYFIEVEKKYKAKNRLSPAEQLLEQARFMVELERRMDDTEADVKRLEHNIRRTVTSDHLTVIAYANMNNIKPKSYNSSVVGRKAAKLCRERNINIGKVVDSKYGLIGTYPIVILDEVFRELGL